jgi:hypothetical protein
LPQTSTSLKRIDTGKKDTNDGVAVEVDGMTTQSDYIEWLLEKDEWWML